MTLRSRFIALLLSTLVIPLLISQGYLLSRFFSIQENTYHSYLQNIASDAKHDLKVLRHTALFSCQLLAESGTLHRYLRREHYHLPQEAAFRAVLKNLATHLKSQQAYRQILLVNPQGVIDIQFDLLGSLPRLAELPDKERILKAVQERNTTLEWLSTEQEPGQLRYIAASAVYADDVSSVTRNQHEAIVGYVIISAAPEKLPAFSLVGGNESLAQDKWVLLRHHDKALIHSPGFDAQLFRNIAALPPIMTASATVNEQRYLVAHANDDTGLSIEAWMPRSALWDEAIPTLLKNAVTSLLQIVIIGILFYFVLNRWLISPLHNAKTLTRQLRAGHWLQRPEQQTPVEKRDEVTRLLDALYDMSDALQETTRALDDKRKQAEEAERLKTEFLANISHEFRTPANIIVGIMTRLEKTLQEPRQKDALNMAKQEALRLVQEVDELILLADLETNKQRVNTVDFYLPDLLQQCVGMIEPLAQQKGLSLSLVTGTTTDCILRGDQQKISKCVEILLGNAVKFTARGGVRIEATGQPSDEKGIRVSIFITDTGVGMAPDAIALLGQTFRQLDGSHVRQHGGLGIGLAICQGLLKLLGSTLQVESTPDKGSRFGFELFLEKGAEMTREPI